VVFVANAVVANEVVNVAVNAVANVAVNVVRPEVKEDSRHSVQ